MINVLNIELRVRRIRYHIGRSDVIMKLICHRIIRYIRGYDNMLEVQMKF